MESSDSGLSYEQALAVSLVIVYMIWVLWGIPVFVGGVVPSVELSYMWKLITLGLTFFYILLIPLAAVVIILWAPFYILLCVYKKIRGKNESGTA